MYQEWLECKVLNNRNSHGDPVLRANPAEGTATAVDSCALQHKAGLCCQGNQVVPGPHLLIPNGRQGASWERRFGVKRLPKAAQQAEKAQRVAQISGSSPGQHEPNGTAGV